ncbi:ArsR/SmtB family transcription factor [Actinacidiphila rubida]|uniref:Helix-turn-helix domain-containing protein n=1 Tax=Actinacidiphila rubida TaxID=310780 RepID=A0A1H8FSM4_9ACTN|nr:winged helix-turn-helix domain-containing protein [Actinacidiphila rubida]SEN34682.1 Helix-turn-helix domain-containing protein [Actinacidiphila rubida]
MTLRIHFTPEDLARVTVAPGTSILWEAVLSLHTLRSARVPPAYREWRDGTRRRLTASPACRQILLLVSLIPESGDFPDFLTPSQSQDLAEGLEEVRSTPAAFLRSDLSRVFAERRPPDWVRQLAGGGTAELAPVAEALRVYADAVLAPCRDAVDAAVGTDRSLRGRTLMNGGVGQLLGGLPAPVRWTAPVLETPYPVDRDLRLDGRGLTLVPAYFCWGAPVTLIDEELPPVLVYPAAGPATGPTPGTANRHLTALLGRTRANALRALCVPHSTTELARRIGTTAGSASKHAAVLRGSGLITSTRHGNTVIHVITPVGQTLLAPPPGP